MRKIFTISFPFFMLFIAIGEIWGQETNVSKNGWKLNYKDYTIIHKAGDNKTHGPTKWHDLREGVATTLERFDTETKYFTIGNNIKIQPAHHTVGTIYVHPGQTITLYSPDINDTSGGAGNTNNKTYQRWYDYKTDGTFYSKVNGTEVDLLAPLEGKNGYLLKNGYVGTPLTIPTTYNNFNNSVLHAVKFTYPEDGADEEYIVACDVSIYTDYGDEEFESITSLEGNATLISAFKNETEQKCYEPTIGHRLIYYIRSIDRPETITEDEDDPYLYRRKLYEQKDGTEESFVAEYTIHFPTKHVSTNTKEVVGLRMDAQNYKVPKFDGSNATTDDGNNYSIHRYRE